METISPSQSGQRWYRGLAFVVIALNLAVTIGFKIYSGGFHEWALTPWALLPMAVLCAAAVVAATHRAGLIVLAATILCLVLTAYVYLKGFVLHPDPRSGILYLRVPFYQLVWACVLFGIAGVDRLKYMDRLEESTAPPPPDSDPDIAPPRRRKRPYDYRKIPRPPRDNLHRPQ